VTGQRKSVKILGAIELWKARFHYRQETVFNASTYFASWNNWLAAIDGREPCSFRTTRHTIRVARYGPGSMPIATGSSSPAALFTGAEPYRALVEITRAKQGLIIDIFRARKN
jgi:hypothetical protein